MTVEKGMVFKCSHPEYLGIWKVEITKQGLDNVQKLGVINLGSGKHATLFYLKSTKEYYDFESFMQTNSIDFLRRT